MANVIPPGGADAGTVVRVAKYWQLAGGSEAHWIPAVAVAMAESGGNTDAVSPSHDYGVWQINRIHFGDGIIDSSNWSDPITNAREAVKLSGDGTNWAPWCTAWIDPARDCGHGHLSSPQAGSPAAGWLAAVAAVLGGVPPPAEKAASTAGRQAAQNGWHYLWWVLTTWSGKVPGEAHDIGQWTTNLINSA